MIHRRRSLPGFGLTLGVTVAYVSLMVLIPVSAMVMRSVSGGLGAFWTAAVSSRALAAYGLTLRTALGGALTNAVFGLVVAWVLARYPFPGRRIVDAFVDLPFALPTAVAGIALTSLYAPNGWIGRPLASLGFRVAFTPLGIGVALTFVGLPFVVRTLQPVIEALGADVEEAAASLGANRFQTFVRVILPALIPAWLTGFTLAFARALGEYGSVVFIAGNMPMRTEIAPLLIMTRLEQYDYVGATAIAVVLLVGSFMMLGTINLLQSWQVRRSA
jgi:sulfate/thiosulfate transport system permease protein